MRWFEDYEVGRIERVGGYQVTREEVVEFASKYDPQPFHLDDAAAEASPIFGRLAASGWHTCAMTMRMLTDGWTEDGHFSLGGNAVDELRWMKPVYPGLTSCPIFQDHLKPTFPRWTPREGRLRARLPCGTALRNRILACWRFQPLLDAPI